VPHVSVPRSATQFSVGVRSSVSMTKSSAACRRRSSLSPSCSWTAPNIAGPELPLLASPAVIQSSLKS